MPLPGCKGKNVKIELSENFERNADELDRLAQNFWDAGLVMAGTLIAAAALSVREAADSAPRAGAAALSSPSIPRQNTSGGGGQTVH
jgi:hypothetical protein